MSALVRLSYRFSGRQLIVALYGVTAALGGLYGWIAYDESAPESGQL